MTLFPLFLTLFLNGNTSSINSVDSGYRHADHQYSNFKYDIPFSCKKVASADSIIFYYNFSDITISRFEEDTFKIVSPPATFKYCRKNQALYWNNIKLHHQKTKAIDTATGVECDRYVYDARYSIDEETMFYFSPEYGLLYEYNIAWGNPSSYIFLSGNLRGKELNFMVPGAKKRRN